MIPVPTMRTQPGRTHLVSGRKLNALMAAIQARTQLDAEDAGAKGTRGVMVDGGAQIDSVLNQRFIDGQLYVLTADFLRRLEVAILARTPREAAEQTAHGYKPHGAATSAKTPRADRSARGIADVLALLHRLTPRDTGLTTPRGYRFIAPPLPPRPLAMALEVQDRWAEAWFCYAGDGGSLPSATLHAIASVTSHFANGDIVTTTTAAGLRVRFPGSADPVECTSPEITDDEIDGFDYGALIETDAPVYSGASLATEDLKDEAIDALADDGPAYDAFTWSWLSDSAQPYFGGLDLARWQVISTSDVRVQRPKYRWRNDGTARLRVEWDQGGSHHNIIVEAGTVTDWYESDVPATREIYDAVANVEFSFTW